MKKLLTLSLAMAFFLGAAPLFAASQEPGNPCIRPEHNTDAQATQNYEFCMAEYIKSLKLTGAERELALEKAESALKTHMDLQR